jgi:probable poly-beta-1,6-N-acetyl-D-glucosamine export protein
MPTQRLVVFDYFRAVAIVLIVAGHSFFRWDINTSLERAAANIIQGGTCLFVFASGFFFVHVYSGTFSYGRFLTTKVKNVLAPYLFLSLLIFSYYVLTGAEFPALKTLGLEDPQSTPDSLLLLGFYLITGTVSVPFWFVPFIMVIFLISPLFLRLLGLSMRLRWIVFTALLVISTVSHRPPGNVGVMHAMAYFLPMFVLGMNVAVDWNSFREKVRSGVVLWGAGVLFFALLDASTRSTYGNQHKESVFSYQGLDMIVVQKIFLVFFLLSSLQRVEHIRIPALTFIGYASFAVFFLHFSIVLILENTLRTLLGPLPGLICTGTICALSLALSLLLAALAKKVLGENSRYLTGY